MKKLFSLALLAMMMVTGKTFAQSSMLATLSHEGEITTYYGATAYREAVNAASHGDIITLSSGSFGAVNITKALTIRGAGMAVDTVAKTYPTILSGYFSIQIPDSVNQRLTMEGIYNDQSITVKGTLKNATFLKDRLRSITYENSSTTKMSNLTFIHCKISNELNLPTTGSASCVNCYITDPYSISSTTSNFEFTNCVIRFTSYGTYLGSPSMVRSSLYQNCVIYHTNGHSSSLPSSCTAYYCVGRTDSNSNLFSNQTNTTNWNLGSAAYSGLFKTCTGGYNDEETFELAVAAKTKYIGDYGKQVGMYGGDLPFTATPTNPQITKCNVAAKSTADGKLSVDIEVSAAE